MTSNMQVNYWWVTHVSAPPPAHDSSLWAQQTSLLRWWQTHQWVSCQELKCRCLVSVFAALYRIEGLLIITLLVTSTSPLNILCKKVHSSTTSQFVPRLKGRPNENIWMIVLPVRRVVCSMNIQYEWTCCRRSRRQFSHPSAYICFFVLFFAVQTSKVE